MTYFGCKTCCNKFSWSLFAILTTAAFVGVVCSLYYFIRCMWDDYYPCMDQTAYQVEQTESDKNVDQDAQIELLLNRYTGESNNENITMCEERLAKCVLPVLPLTFVGSIIFLVLAFIPLFVMCTCSSQPTNIKYGKGLKIKKQTRTKYDDNRPLSKLLLDDNNQEEIISFPLELNDSESLQNSV